MYLLSVQIPFVEPVIIITLLLVIILIGPVLFERIRIPAIVGLLLSGALIGQHGFNLIGGDLEFTLLGTMGLLYLMFLAGLEIDIIDFLDNKIKSIFIGLASFLVPFLLGFLVSRYLLDYSMYASWLIGAMLSSHTLISYPLMGRLGIINKPIVTIIVGATIIADVLALVSMELIIDFAEADDALDSMMGLLLNFLGFFAVIFLVIPRVSRLFLNRYEGELGVQYIFVLVILFLSALIAHLLHLEPILGAFFSGLVLNRQIINTSPLYRRIEFIGNTLFIPVFLISIGMLANFKVYLDDPRQIWLLLVFIVVALASKYLAALLSRIIFRISGAETNLVFGMSVSRAASAVAIILIGFNLDIVSESVLNNTVILILITSILSTYVTERAGKQILLQANNTVFRKKKVRQKLLVPIANPETMGSLIDFTIMIKEDDHEQPVYPLTVVTGGDQVRERIDNNRVEVRKVLDAVQADDIHFETSSRIDNSITNGIVKAAEELVATGIIMGWNTGKMPFYRLFGNVMSNLLKRSERMLLVLKTPVEFRKIRNIHVFCTDDAEYEEGFALWLDTLSLLFSRLKIKGIFYSESSKTLDAILRHGKNNNTAKYFELYRDATPQQIEKELHHSPTDLLIFIHSRRKTVSFNKKFEQFMNQTINQYGNNNILVIYPEQW